MVQVHPPRSHAIHARVRSFSRAGGRLTAAQSEALERFGPAYVIDVPRRDAIRTVAADFRLDPAVLFPAALAAAGGDDSAARPGPAARPGGLGGSGGADAGARPGPAARLVGSRPLIVEVGSGGGEAILAHAAAHPGTDYLAVEVWETAIARIVRDAARAGLTNVRVVPADASQLLAVALPVGCASEVWTFFPDPWRKPRHRKRRLVSPEFADAVARVLAPGGVWRLATDWADYAWQMRDVLEEAAGLLGAAGPTAAGLTDAAGPTAAGSGRVASPAAAPYFCLPDAGARPDLGASTWQEGSLGNGPDPGSPAGRLGGWSPRFEGRVLTRFEQRGITEGRTIRDLTAVRTTVHYRGPAWAQTAGDPAGADAPRPASSPSAAPRPHPPLEAAGPTHHTGARPDAAAATASCPSQEQA